MAESQTVLPIPLTLENVTALISVYWVLVEKYEMERGTQESSIGSKIRSQSGHNSGVNPCVTTRVGGLILPHANGHYCLDDQGALGILRF